MKKILLLIISLNLFANELDDLLNKLDNNLLIKSKQYEIEAYTNKYNSTKGLNLPQIYFKTSYIHLKDTPQFAMQLTPTTTTWFDAGTKDIYSAEVTLQYPIFSGYGISNLINKAKFDKTIAKLQQQDLKRNLKLKLIILYGKLYSLNTLKQALEDAKIALESSLKKAQSFYELELLPKSGVLNIKANLYKIKANIQQSQTQFTIINNEIKYLTSSFAKAITLPDTKIIKADIENRADIVALKTMLLSTKADIELANSKFYPNVNFIASYKKFGDDFSLDGDGHKNPNQSYVGVELKYNLFNGYSDKSNLQGAKAKYLAKQLYVEDYIKNIKKELDNELLKLNSLEENLKWANEELKASNEYLKLTLARFNQQLVSSDELNQAIANNAKTKANLQNIQSEIFIQKNKINLIQE